MQHLLLLLCFLSFFFFLLLLYEQQIHQKKQCHTSTTIVTAATTAAREDRRAIHPCTDRRQYRYLTRLRMAEKGSTATLPVDGTDPQRPEAGKRGRQSRQERWTMDGCAEPQSGRPVHGIMHAYRRRRPHIAELKIQMLVGPGQQRSPLSGGRARGRGRGPIASSFDERMFYFNHSTQS